MSQITLGSLFDGSGGFPLAGELCGVEPLWASEIEPYPIAVTSSRFPNMKHLGNVSDIRGGDIEPVDIITFGSPCQDMSVAGKRAGLKHEVNGDDETTRSGLFMEAVRIIREMRKATNGAYPRFVLWENVPGAFSSNKGEDFRTVLGELVKIVEPNAVMPAVPKAGWPYADSYRGDGWSLAYRIFDAQYWGVPQRRKRIYLVLDLRGERAGKILFEREGVRWDSAKSRETREGAADDAEGGAGGCVCYGICSYASNAMLSSNPNSGIYEAKTSRTIDINGGNPACNQGGICVVYQEKARTLAARYDSSPCVDRGGNVIVQSYQKVVGALCMDDYKGSNRKYIDQDKLVVYDQKRIGQYGQTGTASTLMARLHKSAADVVVEKDRRYIVRRLTPLECCRLQGFPDGWGDTPCKDRLSDDEYQFWVNVRNTHASVNGKAVKDYTREQMLKWYNGLHTDSAEYKMWGNGIALPTALYCMQGIAAEINKEMKV